MSQYQPPQSPNPQPDSGQPQPPQWGSQPPMQWNQQAPLQYQPQWQQPLSQPLPPQQQWNPQQQWQQPPVPPQPLPPRKSRKGLFIVLGVILAIVLVACIGISALVAAGGKAAQQVVNQASTQVAQQPQSTQASQPTTTSAQAPKMGVPFVVDPTWTVTVNSFKTSRGDQFSTPRSGNNFVVVDVTVKNTSSSNQIVSSLVMFNLKDSTGQQYTESITDFAKAPDGTVTLGSLLRGQLVYEVPASQHSFTFSFQGYLAGNDLTEWNLNI